MLEDIAALPLLSHDRTATVDRDAQALAARLAQHYSLLDFGPRLGSERSFLHRSSSARAGDLLLTCGFHQSLLRWSRPLSGGWPRDGGYRCVGAALSGGS